MSNILIIKHAQEQFWDKINHEFNVEKAFGLETQINIHDTPISVVYINRQDDESLQLAYKLTYDQIQITDDLLSARFYNKDFGGIFVMCFVDIYDHDTEVLDTSYVKYQLSANVLRFIKDPKFNEIEYIYDGDISYEEELEVLKFMVPMQYFNNYAANVSDDINDLAWHFDIYEEQAELLMNS